MVNTVLNSCWPHVHHLSPLGMAVNQSKEVVAILLSKINVYSLPHLSRPPPWVQQCTRQYILYCLHNFHHQLNLSVQFWPPNVASSDSFLCYYDWMFFMQFAFVCSSTMAEWWHAFLTRLILGQLLAHACVWSRVSGLYQIHNFASWLGGSSKLLLIQDLFWSLPWCLLCPLTNRQVRWKRRFQPLFSGCCTEDMIKHLHCHVL